MGRIIFIEKAIAYADPYQSQQATNQTPSQFPVQFEPTYNNGGFGLRGFVAIPAEPPARPPVIRQDNPMNTQFDLYSFGQSYNFSIRRGGIPSEPPTIRMVYRSQIERVFWDLKEIEDFVAPWKGDLLMQPTDNGWCFAPTNDVERLLFFERLNQDKNYGFALPTLSQKKLKAWLYKNVTDCDMPNTSMIFIRDEDEAIHFKLRWLDNHFDEEDMEDDEDIPF